MMQVAYIAGPYRAATVHGMHRNIDKAAEVALKYWKLGYAVICPHKNTAFFDGECPDNVWLNGDLELLRRSDLVVMVPGWEQSEGARVERLAAVEAGIPIIYDTGEL
jgi:hypothetical protein